jgi:hypothetical protein
MVLPLSNTRVERQRCWGCVWALEGGTGAGVATVVDNGFVSTASGSGLAAVTAGTEDATGCADCGCAG